MTSTIEQMQTVFDEADCLLNQSQIEKAITNMADKVCEDMKDQNPLVLCVMNGGLILTGKLLPRLHFPLQLDYIHATRYRMETSGSQLDWQVKPHNNLKDRHVLLVDDILDEGKTLLELVQFCEQQAAASVKTAVLVNKLHDRKVSPTVKADYCELDVEDRFVFGYGMDYKGYWRNAPGIYAVKGL